MNECSGGYVVTAADVPVGYLENNISNNGDAAGHRWDFTTPQPARADGKRLVTLTSSARPVQVTWAMRCLANRGADWSMHRILDSRSRFALRHVPGCPCSEQAVRCTSSLYAGMYCGACV